MLAIKNRHERDHDLEFKEETHTYTYKAKKKFISVTTLIHEFFPKFDADKIIANMMNSVKWKDSPYFGMTTNDIKAKWDKNRDEAAGLGTKMHKQIEDYLNDGSLPDTPSVEFQYFYNFWQIFMKDNPDWKPYRTEWMVFDEDKTLAGSIDCVLSNGKELILFDWKRSKDIKLDNKYSKGIGPFQGLPDCNFCHYCIQLNCYRHILETKYNAKVKDMYLLVCHPNQPAAIYHQVPRLDDVINLLWTYLPLDTTTH